MIALACVVAVVVGILLLPVGVRLAYDAKGATLHLLISKVPIQLYPWVKNVNKRRTTKINRKRNMVSSKGKTRSGGSLSDFLPLCRVVLDLLKDLRQKLVVDQLVFDLVLVGEDPCDLSLNYGRAWAALGHLMPRLESVFSVRKQDVNISCDFTGECSSVFFLMDLKMSVVRLIVLAARYGWRGFIEYRKLLKIKKGGA